MMMMAMFDWFWILLSGPSLKIYEIWLMSDWFNGTFMTLSHGFWFPHLCIQFLGEFPLPCIRKSVSYTHLDVYKRQKQA